MKREFGHQQQITGGKIADTTAIGSAATSLFIEMLPMPMPVSLPRRKDGGHGGVMQFVKPESVRKDLTSRWATADRMLEICCPEPNGNESR